MTTFEKTVCTVKLGFKERLNKEQLGNSEPFSVTNLPVYLINSEQIAISEQFCDDQKVSYCQARPGFDDRHEYLSVQINSSSP